MQRVLVETTEGETKELYLGCDGGLYQEDPDPVMQGYSRIMWESEARKKGWIIIKQSH